VIHSVELLLGDQLPPSVAYTGATATDIAQVLGDAEPLSTR
jgi:hypothetical protein